MDVVIESRCSISLHYCSYLYLIQLPGSLCLSQRLYIYIYTFPSSIIHRLNSVFYLIPIPLCISLFCFNLFFSQALTQLFFFLPAQVQFAQPFLCNHGGVYSDAKVHFYGVLSGREEQKVRCSSLTVTPAVMLPFCHLTCAHFNMRAYTCSGKLALT